MYVRTGGLNHNHEKMQLDVDMSPPARLGLTLLTFDLDPHDL